MHAYKETTRTRLSDSNTLAHPLKSEDSGTSSSDEAEDALGDVGAGGASVLGNALVSGAWAAADDGGGHDAGRLVASWGDHGDVGVLGGGHGAHGGVGHWLGDGDAAGGGVGVVVHGEGRGVRAVSGVDGCGGWVGSGLGRLGGGGGVVGGGGAGLGLLVVRVGDAELGGVLVLAGCVVDQLNAVSESWGGCVGGSELVRWSPDVSARVLDVLDDGVLRNGVGGWALEEDKSDGAIGCWVPGNSEALSDWDDRVEAWLRDWVAL